MADEPREDGGYSFDRARVVAFIWCLFELARCNRLNAVELFDALRASMLAVDRLLADRIKEAADSGRLDDLGEQAAQARDDAYL